MLLLRTGGGTVRGLFTNDGEGYALRAFSHVLVRVEDHVASVKMCLNVFLKNCAVSFYQRKKELVVLR